MTEQTQGQLATVKSALRVRPWLAPLGLIGAGLLASAVYQYWPASPAAPEIPEIREIVADSNLPLPPLPTPAPDQSTLGLRPSGGEGKAQEPATPPAPEPEPAPEAIQILPDVGAKLDRLDSAIGAMAALMSDLNVTVAGLAARVAELEAAAPPAGLPQRISLSLALRELERALAGSGPFVIELQAVEKLAQLAADDPALAGLRTHATTGIDSQPTLAAQFAPVASAVVRADAAERQAEAGGRLYAWISSLITIRPVGERAGDDAPAIVARAEARLARGDLEAAVRELEGLRGGAALAAAEWLGRARARLDAGQALAALNARLAEALSEKRE